MGRLKMWQRTVLITIICSLMLFLLFNQEAIDNVDIADTQSLETGNIVDKMADKMADKSLPVSKNRINRDDYWLQQSDDKNEIKEDLPKGRETPFDKALDVKEQYKLKFNLLLY